MSATNTFDFLMKRFYAGMISELLKVPDLMTPEWRAWADEWREEVPLTAEQKLENDAWRKCVKEAREELARLHQKYQEDVARIEGTYGVSAVTEDDGSYEVDDYDPPHKTTYRTKDGAPPEPPAPVKIPTMKRNV